MIGFDRNSLFFIFKKRNVFIFVSCIFNDIDEKPDSLHKAFSARKKTRTRCELNNSNFSSVTHHISIFFSHRTNIGGCHDLFTAHLPVLHLFKVAEWEIPGQDPRGFPPSSVANMCQNKSLHCHTLAAVIESYYSLVLLRIEQKTRPANWSCVQIYSAVANFTCALV